MRFNKYLQKELRDLKESVTFLNETQQQSERIKKLLDDKKTWNNHVLLDRIENEIIVQEMLPRFKKIVEKNPITNGKKDIILSMFMNSKMRGSKASIYHSFLILLEADGCIDWGKIPTRKMTSMKDLLIPEVSEMESQGSNGLTTFILDFSGKLNSISSQGLGKGEVMLALIGQARSGGHSDLQKGGVKYEVKGPGGRMEAKELNVAAGKKYLMSEIKKKSDSINIEFYKHITKTGWGLWHHTGKALELIKNGEKGKNNHQRMYTTLATINSQKFTLDLINGTLKALGSSMTLGKNVVNMNGTINKEFSKDVAKYSLIEYQKHTGHDYVLIINGPGMRNGSKNIHMSLAKSYDDFDKLLKFGDFTGSQIAFGSQSGGIATHTDIDSVR